MLQTHREQELAGAFAEIARVLLAEPDVQHTLDKMCELLVVTVDGCEHAVVTLLENEQLDSPASSDDVGPAVDAIQFEVGEGPCVQAIREHETFHTDDLTSEMRWPRFAHRASEETGVRSMVAFRLFLEQETMGSLNLYSKRPSAFSEDSVAVGTIFAAHAAVALRAARAQEDLEHLRKAVQTRDLIARANTILMARKGISSEAAAEMLCRAAQRLKIKLGELARRVVADDEQRQGRDG